MVFYCAPAGTEALSSYYWLYGRALAVCAVRRLFPGSGRRPELYARAERDEKFCNGLRNIFNNLLPNASGVSKVFG